MSQAFELKRIREITPSFGEDLGGTLARLAVAEAERFAANPNAKVMYWGGTVAQLFYLAAEAYEAGAAASIGHNRTDRYLSAARTHRAAAEQLETAAKAQRDEIEDASMMTAFLAGYADCGMDRAPSRYAFNSRDAWLLGKHFGNSDKPMPDRVHGFYTNGRYYIAVDEVTFEIVYPEGKTDKAYPRVVATD